MKTNTPKTVLAAISLIMLFGGCSKTPFKSVDSMPQLEHSFYHVNLTDQNGQETEKSLIVVTIDPKEYELSIEVNPDRGNPKTIRQMPEENKSLLTFNGSFFTEQFRSTGLLVSKDGELESQSRAALLNGIIAIDKEKTAHFFNSSDFPKTPEATPSPWEFAIQNGPVLLRDEVIAVSENSTDTASRTALGIDNSGNLVLIVVKQSLLKSSNVLSLYEFARMLKESPELKELNLHSVLNLDGGRSTGLMIGENYYAEMDYVQNVVTVKKRS